MLMFTGKRTSLMRIPKQIRVSPELNQRISLLARLGDRSMSHQVLHLVLQGIRYEEIIKSQEVTKSPI